MARILRDIPLNRVEGDLEIRIEIEDGIITDAWSSGTLYRGFEAMMTGRAPLDGLVVTPRICGICSTTHLKAAAKALDRIAGATPTGTAMNLRSLALAAEHMQSDVRQSVLMFMADFAGPAHAGQPLHAEAARRYAPLAGERAIDVIRHSKRLLEVVALIGGQWPHSSFMVPGGVAYVPPPGTLLQCRQIVRGFRAWYEASVLGCSIERWQAVTGARGLEAWLEEAESHRASDVGFLLRYGAALGLDRIGRGHGAFLCAGGFDQPDAAPLLPAGYLDGDGAATFDQARIAEDVSHSWYVDDGVARHPFEGRTQPQPGGEGRHTWAKAPRYAGRPAETGPLAEVAVAGEPLFADLLRRGPNALVRQLARLTRPARLLPAAERWLDEVLRDGGGAACAPARLPDEGEGFGLIEAARGALGHWVRIREGRIASYQVVTPTAWNGSPRDRSGVRGPWEQALVGTPVADPDHPIEAGYVVRSFDPCLVCTVHTLTPRGTAGRLRLAT